MQKSFVQGHVHGTGLKAGIYQAPVMHVGDVSKTKGQDSLAFCLKLQSFKETGINITFDEILVVHYALMELNRRLDPTDNKLIE